MANLQHDTPTWEVVLRVGGADIAVVSCFQYSDGSYAVVVGVEDKAFILAYADLIREAAFQAGTARDFISRDEVAAAADNGNETSFPPW